MERQSPADMQAVKTIDAHTYTTPTTVTMATTSCSDSTLCTQAPLASLSILPSDQQAVRVRGSTRVSCTDCFIITANNVFMSRPNRWSSTPSTDLRAWQLSTCITCTQLSSSTWCCRQQPCSRASTSTNLSCRAWPPFHRSVCVYERERVWGSKELFECKIVKELKLISMFLHNTITRLLFVRGSCHLPHPLTVWFLLLVFLKPQ